MAPYELRPRLEALEVPTDSDFVYETAIQRDRYPNRFFYVMEEDAFGGLPRIYLEMKFRLLMNDNTDLDPSQYDMTSVILARTRITIDSGQYRDWVNYRVELQDSQATFSPSPESERDHLDVRQAYVCVSRSRALWNIKFGRMELDFGSGRIIGSDWQDNIDRSYDGLRVSYSDRWERFEPRQWSWRTDVFGAAPVESRALEFNGHHDEPEISGAFYGDRRLYPLQLEAGIVFSFARGDGVPIKLGGAPRASLSTFSGRVFSERLGSNENLAFDAELALQFGDCGGQEHLASCGGASASYTFPTPWQVRLHAGIEGASGDSDLGDDTCNTFYPLFPGDMRGRYGQTRLLGQRNALVWSLGSSFGPLEDFRIGADVRWLNLYQSSDYWYDAEGEIRTASRGALGWELDISGRYTFVSASGKEIGIEGAYAIFEPYGVQNDASGEVQTLFVQAWLKF